MSKNFFSQRGMGLIEVVLGAGMMGLLAFAVMKMTSDTTSTGKSAEYNQDARDFATHMAQVLSSERACKNTFQGMNATNTAVGEIKDAQGNTAMDMNTVYGTSGAKMSLMTLSDLPGTGDGAEVNPGQRGTTNLVIRFATKKGSLHESREVQQKVRLMVVTDASSNIVSCFSMSQGDQHLWKRQESSPTNIFYPGRNVGIGTENPRTKLDVAGAIRVNSEGGGTLTFGGNGSDYRISLTSALPLELWNDGASEPANLLMGSSSSTGYVQLSATFEACTPLNQGAMHFNMGLQKVLICESGIWVQKKSGSEYYSYTP